MTKTTTRTTDNPKRTTTKRTRAKTTLTRPNSAMEIDCPRDYPDAPAGKLRIQPGLPMSFKFFGITVLNAEFRRLPSEPDRWYVELEAAIGMLPAPYVLVITVPQALAADIIETV